jgi:hypothetical protein
MHTADREILAATLLEYVAVGRTWITLEVVQRKDLLQVREIILACLHLGVMAHVLERGQRTSMIEGLIAMGHDKEQMAFGADYALPFRKRAKRIGEMLEDVGRKQRVVRAVRHTV